MKKTFVKYKRKFNNICHGDIKEDFKVHTQNSLFYSNYHIIEKTFKIIIIRKKYFKNCYLKDRKNKYKLFHINLKILTLMSKILFYFLL